MNISRKQRNIYILLGLGILVGLASGFFGIGGGAILVPSFMFLFGFDKKKANGTSLTILAFVSLLAVYIYQDNNFLNLRIAVYVFIGSMLGAITGSRTLRFIQKDHIKELLLGLLFLTGLVMILGGSRIEIFDRHPVLQAGSIQYWIAVFTGFLAAIIGTWLELGGGIVIVPALTMIAGIEQHLSQGISLALLFATSGVGSIVHMKINNIDYRVAIWTSLGAVAGLMLGIHLLMLIHTELLKVAFGSLLILAIISVVLIQKILKSYLNKRFMQNQNV